MKRRRSLLALVALASVLALSCAGGAPAAPTATSTTPAASKTSGLSEGQRLAKSLALAEDARRFLDQDKVAEGFDRAQEALALDPDCVDALIQQGRAYGRMRKLSKAVEYLERAIKLSGASYEALMRFGTVYREAGDAAKAMEYFTAAQAKQPGNNWAYREIGGLYLWQLSDFALAAKNLEDAVRYGANDPWIYNDLSTAYEKLGDSAKAKEYFLKAKALVDAGQGDSWIKGEVAAKAKKYLN